MLASNNTFLSLEEKRAAHQRVFQDAYDRLVIGPGQAFLAAGCAVFGVGCLEGWQYVRPSSFMSFSQKMQLVARYGLAQVIPSVIWGKQSAWTIARVVGIAMDDEKLKTMLYNNKDLPGRREMAVKRLIAIRGALAGTILISQVISFASVASEAKTMYSDRIEAGKERPLNVATNSRNNSQNGVVIRLAGKSSDVTSLTMSREDDTQQSKGKQKKLLVLEADANRDDAGALSLAKSHVTAADLDLDLYEVAQGFYQLQKLVEINDSASDDEHDTLCVLLADAESLVQRGGGEQMTVRDYVFKLGLADIVIGTQAPLVLALRQWLESKNHAAGSKWKQKHVIVETPEVPWFQSMIKALKQMGGYEVIDTVEAVRIYGSAEGLPMIVYESNTINTTHTIHNILRQNMTAQENICGLCSSHQGLEETSVKDDKAEVTVICSSDLQDRLFRHVREAAMNGLSKEEIQKQLDGDLATLLKKSSKERDWKLRLYL